MCVVKYARLLAFQEKTHLAFMTSCTPVIMKSHCYVRNNDLLSSLHKMKIISLNWIVQLCRLSIAERLFIICVYGKSVSVLSQMKIVQRLLGQINANDVEIVENK